MRKAMLALMGALVLLGTEAAHPNGRSAEVEAAKLEGRWEKVFLVDKGVRNQDPRWELAVHFNADGRFSYVSRSTTEVWLTNGKSSPVVEEVDVKGTWALDEEGRIVIELDRTPTDRQLSALESNLAFDAKLGRATVSCDFDGTLMRMRGLHGQRELFFKKARAR